MVRTSEIVSETAAVLKKAGIESPFFEAELLASYAAGISRTRLVAMMPDRYPSAAQAKLSGIVRRRAAREPFSYITGTKEFYGIEFKVTPDVLIPRPETEFLVDAAVTLLPENGAFLDLCCGSGIVGIAVKKNRTDAAVTASDISAGALALAEINAQDILGDGMIRYIESDLFGSIKDRFDMIAANPPYVSGNEMSELQPELMFEPESALFSDDDGFLHTAEIIKGAAGHLKENGVLIIESNPVLKDKITEYADIHGYRITVENDLAGFPRFYYMRTDKYCE